MKAVYTASSSKPNSSGRSETAPCFLLHLRGEPESIPRQAASRGGILLIARRGVPKTLAYSFRAARNRSASIAAAQPIPAAVIAWR